MRLLIIALLSTIFGASLDAQGIEFFKGSWEEALALAKEEDKIIFVDAYAVWCGPCKRMAKDVFTDQKVGQFYNKNFINVKMDMERGEGPKFGKTYPVSAYPTLMYIDGEGKLVTKATGALGIDRFLDLGSTALSRIDLLSDYKQAYEKGDRDPKMILKYVTALNRSGESSLKVANEYLKGQKDLTTPHNLRFLMEATTVSDSRIFNLFIKHRKAIEQITSKAEVQEKIFSACEKTIERAIEFESETLLEEAIENMKKHYPEKATTFESDESMHYYLGLKDAPNYIEVCKKYAKKTGKNKPEDLQGIALTLVKYFRSKPIAMQEAESFAKSAAKVGKQSQYYMTYAQILGWNGKKTEALKAAEQALKLVPKEDPEVKKVVEALIEEIELN